jgi:hypothetical protein
LVLSNGRKSFRTLWPCLLLELSEDGVKLWSEILGRWRGGECLNWRDLMKLVVNDSGFGYLRWC